MSLETEKPKSPKETEVESLDFILRTLGNPKKPLPKKDYVPVDDELLDLLDNHFPRSKL